MDIFIQTIFFLYLARTDIALDAAQKCGMRAADKCLIFSNKKSAKHARIWLYAASMTIFYRWVLAVVDHISRYVYHKRRGARRYLYVLNIHINDKVRQKKMTTRMIDDRATYVRVHNGIFEAQPRVAMHNWHMGKNANGGNVPRQAIHI